MVVGKEEKGVIEKPIQKNSYLIKESTPDRAYNLLSKSISSGYKGLCITRTDPADLKNQYNLNVSVVWLIKQKNKDFLTGTSVNILKTKVKNFIKANKKAIILLDRLDYLISIHGFNNVLQFIYSVNDEVLVNDAILLLNINPLTLSQQELALLEQELRELRRPNSKMESGLQDDLQEILVFVNNNEKVSFKHINKKFSITRATTRKRIDRLQKKGLVVIKKNGRNKIVRITDYGRGFL